MNAQEAAKVIHQGMEKLSLSQLMSVRGALQDEAEYAQQFGMVNGFAKAKLGTYARSSKEVQQKMTLEDAQSLQEMVDYYGWDDKDNLTEDGRKVLEIAARVSKREKEKQVIKIVETVRQQETPLTQAQKDVLDGHGFMYGETLESVGNFQSAAEAMKVLRDEGVLSAEAEKKQTEKKPEPVAQKEEKGTPLTAEQIRVLDAKGINHDGTLESLAWFRNRDEAIKILEEAGQKPEKTPAAPIMEVKEIDNKEDAVNANNVSNIDINKNMTFLDKLSTVTNPLNEQDERFADSRASLGVLNVVDEKGKEYDVREVLVEQAKLKTELDLHDAKNLTPEAYVERLKFNIDMAVFSVLSGNEVDKYKGDQEQLKKAMQTKIDVFTKADKYHPSKAHVRLESVLGFLSVTSANMDAKVEQIENLIGNQPIVQKFKSKMSRLDDKAEKLFGPKVWNKARGLGVILQKSAPALGMAAVAGFGGPIGMGVYAAYTFNKYAMPFVKQYTQSDYTSFSKYAKDNKGEAVKATLYTASSLLSLGAAGLGAFTQLGGPDVVAQATMVSKHVNLTKAITSGTAMMTASAISVGEAVKSGDKKTIRNRLLMAVGSAAMFAGGMWMRDAFGKHFAGEGPHEKLDAPDPSKVAGTHEVLPIVDRDGDGIPDTIDRDGGDGTANEPVAPVHVYDDFYHGAEVEARSHNSVISLLTNSEVSRTEATLKAEMMIYRVGNMDDSVRQAFPDASNAQIAHAILLRASDVRKGDADELLRALLGDENCRKLTMEQQVSEIRKGLVGYNYGQRTDLPFGRNLDPNYVGMNTRSRFLLDDCDSERLTDRYGHRVVQEKVIEEKVVPVEPKPVEEKVTPVEPKPVEEKVAPVEPKPVEPKPVEQAPVEEPVVPVKSYKEGSIFVYKDTQSGAHDGITDITVKGGARFADGQFRYVSYEQHMENLKGLKFSDEEAQRIVNERIVSERKEFDALKANGRSSR